MRTLIIIFLFISTSAAGQIGTSVLNRWFIDIPTFKIDSAVLLKEKFSKINIYELSLKDDLTYDKKLFKTWTLNYSDGQISSVPSPTSENQFNTITKRYYQKKQLVEIVGGPCETYKLNHTFNSTGQIIKTDNTCLDCKCESRYHFNWIEYSYANGLLTEASYYTKEHLKYANKASTKFLFEYVK